MDFMTCCILLKHKNSQPNQEYKTETANTSIPIGSFVLLCFVLFDFFGFVLFFLLLLFVCLSLFCFVCFVCLCC